MQKVIEAIRKHDRFLISAHVNLEGDSIGSQLAMKELLKGLGKDSFIIDNDSLPDHYKFLPGAADVSNDLKNCPEFDAAIVLDCPNLRRIGAVKGIIPGAKPVICIDHHISNEKFGQVNWVDPTASSAGEMVFRLFKELKVPITKDVALCLYIAILTDTGSFNYDNTSQVTHEIAGELLGYGLDPALVSENIYERRSVADIKFLGLVLSTLKVGKTGEIASMEIRKKMLEKTGADIVKAEGIINYARSIDKVKVAVLFKEDARSRRTINVSFRSKGGADVNMLASFFGGGGHVRASGCTLKGSLSSVKRKVLAKAEEVLSKDHRK
jgi:phosphoesterase RecJ-like protein